MNTNKKVLLVDASPMLREFLREKLNAEHIIVETIKGANDGFVKMQESLPDLVILDVEETLEPFLEFLENKFNDPGCKHIPVIINGPALTKERIEHLKQFGVINYFAKPVKFDIFFESIGRILKCAFSMDVTPCILQAHLNGNVVFIEIAEGMNREKIALLKYRIAEIIDKSQLNEPSVLLMMSSMDLSFVDAPNIEMLLDSILSNPKIKKENFKILSQEDFVKDMVDGHPEYNGIQVAKELSSMLSSFIMTDSGSQVQEQVSEKLLASDSNADEAAVALKFVSDSGIIRNEKQDENQPVTIAIVDDDAVIRKILEAVVKSLHAEPVVFISGAEFLQCAARDHYDLVILDIYMPGLSGYDILKNLQDKEYPAPVIIYSQAMSKENMAQALTMGASAYLIKPQQPQIIAAKIKELLDQEKQKTQEA